MYTAADGPAALKAARSFRPGLAVLDLILPGLDGIEVLRRADAGRDAARARWSQPKKRPCTRDFWP